MQVNNWCQLPGVYKVFAVNADGRDEQRVAKGERRKVKAAGAFCRP